MGARQGLKLPPTAPGRVKGMQGIGLRSGMPRGLPAHKPSPRLVNSRQMRVDGGEVGGRRAKNMLAYTMYREQYSSTLPHLLIVVRSTLYVSCTTILTRLNKNT